MDRSKYWMGAVIALFAIFASALMIADVWDETNGMLFFSDASRSLSSKLHFVLTQSLGFWRPLPTLFVAVVLHLIPDFDTSWRVLRAINIGLLVGALALLVDAIGRWNREEPRRLIFAIGFLFSGSAVITAGWYANVFDASALLLIAVGISLLARGHPLAAGFTFGTAFFCKETTVLILPFLLMLWASGRLSWRDLARAAAPAIILGGIYFAIRSRIVAFGSATDVHQFTPEQLLPTIVNLAGSFWFESLKVGTVAGLAFLLLSLATLRRPRLIVAAIVFLGCTVLIYWGMLDDSEANVLISHLNFAGRLYLVPVTLMLFLLVIEGRPLLVAALLIPIITGGVLTYRDHARFQRLYKQIYKTARQAPSRPLVVYYPPKPLDDKVRGIVIGERPDAPVRVNATTGRLEHR
jgi:hypothetical protein